MFHFAILDQVASIGIETVKLLNHVLVKAWYWFWSSHELLSWSSIGLCLSLCQVLVKCWSLPLSWSSFGQVLVFAFALVKFSAFSTLHKPHHLSLQLSVPSRIPTFKFFSFSRASDKCEKVAEIQSPASERAAPNGVGKVCKPSVLPCPMYKLPLAPSQLPTFHRAFKQILILPSRVNWRERSVYEGLQDCSCVVKPLFHIKLLTNSAFTFSVHLLIIWEKSISLQCNVVFTFQFWPIFLNYCSRCLWSCEALCSSSRDKGGLLASPACTALFFV